MGLGMKETMWGVSLLALWLSLTQVALGQLYPLGTSYSSCPLQCFSRYHCPDGQRCVITPCGGTACKLIPTCAFNSSLCPLNSVCVDTPFGLRCIKLPTKPGTCPPRPCPAVAYPACQQHQCDNDFQCPGAAKCCIQCNSCRACEQPQPQTNPICDLPPDPGPCDDEVLRFYYDSNSKQCREFEYGGCGGNKNNFYSISECFKICKQSGGQSPFWK